MSSLCGPLIAGKRARSAATISRVSSTLSVVWVTKASVSGCLGVKALASATVSISVTAPCGNCPMVPITSGWPWWPISTISWPSSKWRCASTCTLDTSGQVASRKNMLRALASAGTLLGTPWAENTTGASVSGISSSSSTKIAPFASRLCTTYLLCTMACRTYTGAPYFCSASSTIWMARSTPAQNPRGAQRRMSRCGLFSMPDQMLSAVLQVKCCCSRHRARAI